MATGGAPFDDEQELHNWTISNGSLDDRLNNMVSLSLSHTINNYINLYDVNTLIITLKLLCSLDRVLINMNTFCELCESCGHFLSRLFIFILGLGCSTEKGQPVIRKEQEEAFRRV